MFKKIIHFQWVIAVASVLFFASNASAQVTPPSILSAKFDAQGKLIVKSSFDAIEGCYLAINGGLKKNSVTTGITSIQLSSNQAEIGKTTMKTLRRYYCKQRTLYVNVELTCINDLIGSATSKAVAVEVPSSNIKR